MLSEPKEPLVGAAVPVVLAGPPLPAFGVVPAAVGPLVVLAIGRTGGGLTPGAPAPAGPGPGLTPLAACPAGGRTFGGTPGLMAACPGLTAFPMGGRAAIGGRTPIAPGCPGAGGRGLAETPGGAETGNLPALRGLTPGVPADGRTGCPFRPPGRTLGFMPGLTAAPPGRTCCPGTPCPGLMGIGSPGLAAICPGPCTGLMVGT